jgi:hypothetical protein
MRYSGRVLGSYALCYAHQSNDILEDDVRLVKFFSTAQAAEGAVLKPPALAAWWNRTPLRQFMFPELSAVEA